MSEVLQKIPELFQLKIKHSRYQPDFKPINGKLIAHYNGAILAVTVSGADILCESTTLEGRFTVSSLQVEPGYHTWSQIWEHMLTRVIIAMQCSAIDYIVYLEKEGRYVRH